MTFDYANINLFFGSSHQANRPTGQPCEVTAARAHEISPPLDLAAFALLIGSPFSTIPEINRGDTPSEEIRLRLPNAPVFDNHLIFFIVRTRQLSTLR